MKLRWIALAIGSALLASACTGTAAEDDKTITLIVPFAAGDHADTVARAIAPCLDKQLEDEVVVENRPGEQGVRAAREFVEVGFDQQALLVTPVGAPVVAAAVDPDVGFDFQDFHYVGVVHSAPLILFTAGNGPFDSTERLFAAARAGGAPVEVAHTGATMTEELTLQSLNLDEETRLESARVDSDAELLREVGDGAYPAGLAVATADHLARVESGEITVLAVGSRPGLDWPDALRAYELTVLDMLPDTTVDTTVIAPGNPTDELHLSLTTALDECLKTEEVRRQLGVDFVPDELVTHGKLFSRYHRLQSSVGGVLYRLSGN